MSRLYIIILIIGLPDYSIAQNPIGKYLDFAQEQYDKGDFYYALEYYKKALEIDSNSVDILWKYAETLRSYKDYTNAEKYYAIVYAKENAGIYPYSLLYLGLMQKQNGKYDEAIETFTKAKKKYSKNKSEYLYQKSKRELESTLWAKSAALDVIELDIYQLPETVNTKNSEFGHLIHDGKLIFSSLRADSISETEEVYSTSYKTLLYTSKIELGKFENSKPLEELKFEGLNSGNGTFSLDGKRFYFSKCTENNASYQCKLMVAYYENGKWSSVDSLGEIINQPGSNTTMPCIADWNNEEILVFSSDRKEGQGGLDLYYSKIKNGNQFTEPRQLKTLNSPDNEITPYWDKGTQRLYFSSSWHNNFGGYDIFYSEYLNDFGAPVNAGLPINSSANDLYFFNHLDTIYVSSNRIGVLYSKNPTCCSDIFGFSKPKIIVEETKEETLAELNKRLPVTLYFHNDEPNPKSWDTITPLNYMSTYESYRAMLEKYKKEYSHGLKDAKEEEAKEDIENFFIQYVDQGVVDLQLFRTLLLKELGNGAKINITIKGFASPLAKTEYNVNLTKRRISSLQNHLREYNKGEFRQYLDATAENGGKLLFTQVPFGEYQANQLTSDNPNDVQNSVYSRAAAIERKIEIQSVTYILEDDELPLSTNSPIVNAGVVSKGTIITKEFVLNNTSNQTVRISSLEIPCDCTSAEVNSGIVEPGKSTIVKMSVDTNLIDGFFVKLINVVIEGSENSLQLYISGQID